MKIVILGFWNEPLDFDRQQPTVAELEAWQVIEIT